MWFLIDINILIKLSKVTWKYFFYMIFEFTTLKHRVRENRETNNFNVSRGYTFFEESSRFL